MRFSVKSKIVLEVFDVAWLSHLWIRKVNREYRIIGHI